MSKVVLCANRTIRVSVAHFDLPAAVLSVTNIMSIQYRSISHPSSQTLQVGLPSSTNSNANPVVKSIPTAPQHPHPYSHTPTTSLSAIASIGRQCQSSGDLERGERRPWRKRSGEVADGMGLRVKVEWETICGREGEFEVGTVDSGLSEGEDLLNLSHSEQLSSSDRSIS
jgi:hypothetical protein